MTDLAGRDKKLYVPKKLSVGQFLIRCFIFIFLFSISALFAEASPDPIQQCLDQASAPNPKPSSGIRNAQMTYKQVSVDQLSNRCDEQGSLEDVQKALSYQLDVCRRELYDGLQKIQIGCEEFTRDEWCLKTVKQMVKEANSATDFKAFLRQIRTEFNWYQSSGLQQPTEDGKFAAGQTEVTGYYSPLIKANRTAQGPFQYPIYSRPPDLVEMDQETRGGCGYHWCRKNADGSYSPYFTKEEINGGALKGKGLEIAYVEDPVDAEFMMIQGSGSLDLPDKTGQRGVVRVSYAAQNGRELVMLGRIIKCAGGQVSDYSSMNGIKNYLRAHADQVQKLLNYNLSYIFFREVPDGPIGSEGIPVTPIHSIAVDRSQVPMGIPVLIDVQKSDPGAGQTPSCPITSSLAVAQDTGGAIRGAHFDWYQGTGDQAAASAGKLDNPGWFFIGIIQGAGHAVPGCHQR